MVVGGEQQVESRFFDGRQIVVGGTERGVASVRLPGECHFQVPDGQVGFLYFFLYVLETVGIVVSVGRLCSLYLCVVLHQVSYE